MEYLTHPRIVPGKVEKRAYQVNMAAGCEKKNTLVILPTSLGKTVVAIQVIADFLDRGKVLLMAPTKPLVDQHGASMESMLTCTSTAILNGHMKPEKRAAAVSENELIIATPQTVSNDLLEGRYNLDDFSLVIYDEAHRATGNYAYVTVAQYCHSSIRSIGMTASPGSDEKRIEEVCVNLDLRRIDIRSEDDPDVSPYVHDTYINRITVNMPQDLLEVISLLRSIQERYADELRGMHLVMGNWSVSTKHLLNIQRNLQARLASGEVTSTVYRGLSLTGKSIKVLHAINLAETQGITILKSYLGKLEEEAEQEKGGRSAREITQRPEYRLVRNIVDTTRVEHPKISRAMSIVSRTLNESPESKVIIFTQYRGTCDLLETKLASIPGAKVSKLVGQAKGGMTQKEQIKLLDGFREGQSNVLVATQVGEEGLDIAGADVVLFYEPVPSEIRTIQRRGRTGRKNDGEVYVLVAKGTADEVFEKVAKEREELMRKKLELLSVKLSQGRSGFPNRSQRRIDSYDDMNP